MKFFVVLSALVAAANCQFGNPVGIGNGLGPNIGGYGNPAGIGQNVGGYGNPAGLGQNIGGYGNPAGLGQNIGGLGNGFQPNLPYGSQGLNNNGYGANVAAAGVATANNIPQGYQGPQLAQGYLGTQNPIVGQPGGPNPGQYQAFQAAGLGKK